MSAPLPEPPVTDRELARRLQLRRALFFVAAAVPLFVVADLLIAPEKVLLTLGLRLAWSGWVAGIGWRAHRRSPRGFQLSVALAASGSALFYLVLSWMTGGASSPLFAWNLAVPLAIAAVAQEQRLAVLSGVATSWFGTLALLLLGGEPSKTTAMWLTLLLASALVAIYAGVTYHRLRAAEDVAHDAALRASRQLAESEARRAGAERLALLGRLSAGVAHEVNNPLNILTLNLDLLERAADDPVKREARLRSLREATERISRIVSDLRSWGRESEEHAEVSEVPAAVDLAVRFSALHLRALGKVTCELEPKLPLVAIGERQLSQVLVNLLVNAGDALEEAQTQAPLIRVTARAVGERLELAVEDNGPGIPAALRARILRDVVTTKPLDKGTGLGLTICRDFVERAGGTLHFEDRAGGGTRFVLRLPIAQR